ncbi:MAG: B12-binding domain-containing radical SAM protein [Hominisplanchenecus sp.]|nr:B12-binding domain-containing radical SAM protein [Lachnospiraceae bacterium]MDY2819717.1 B12-binding domain-containing radical SAM protein [Hominisplanchenecus sp.]
MKILLIAVNAKYIHSNLAVYCLRSYAAKLGIRTELVEYTINHRQEDILEDIYRRKPDVAAFSCYIWNLEYVRELIADLHKILPDTEIWAGGPEVSYDTEEFLRSMPQMRGVMKGEGEKTFARLAKLYIEYGKDAFSHLDGCRGIVWRDEKNKLRDNGAAELMTLDEVPFVYEDLTPFDHRILYYESSRGCPFSCSYCLSSIDKRVRFRSMELVERELQFFLDHQVPQVKFVDRTFNCSHRHAMAIWNYIKEHDNGVTNFHFEIAADLLNEEELALLSELRPGLAQLEIGVQSTNPDTIREIDRVMDFEKVSRCVRQVAAAGNIHQHLDLIAGLPFENFDSFIKSFNDVYRLKPEQLQLGFLKVLKGSKMHRRAADYGIVYRDRPMYEVLFSKWISYEEIGILKAVEEMVEVYYNSRQFAHTMDALEEAFVHPFAMYRTLARYYNRKDLNGVRHSRMSRLNILRDFIMEVLAGTVEETVQTVKMSRERAEDLLLTDLYLRENSKSRPEWASDLSGYKEEIQEFYRQEKQQGQYLTDYEGYSWKQMMNMTHMEILSDGSWYLFDYRRRSQLTKDAALYQVRS